MRRLQRIALCLLICCCAAWGTTAAAAQPQDAAQIFAEATARFEAKDYTKALELSQKAFAATGSPNARLYVGRCLHKLGRLAEAYDELYATSRAASAKADKEPRYVRTRDAAAAELAIVEPKVGKLIIVVASRAAGAQVELGGKVLEAERIGKPVAVDPGEVTVAAVHSKHGRTEQIVAAGAGETTTVTLFEAADDDDGGGEPVPQPVPVADDATGAVRIAGIPVLVVGVAGLTVFAVTGLLAKDEFDTVYDACGGTTCPDDSHNEDIDAGKTLQTTAWIGFGMGVAGVLAGTAMIIFGGPDADDSGPGVDVGADGAMLRYRVRF